jgi:hypothetical protein
MARIPDELLNAIVYLFENEERAREGTGDGGTGFFVRYLESGFENWYVISNIHVVRTGHTTLRINTKKGAVETLSISEDLWVDHPHSDDVSVAPLGFEIPSGWAASGLFWDSVCPTEHRMEELDVGVGDDVFMLGRFFGHSGKQQNQPLARFGNIAMMDGERVRDGRDMHVNAYLVEMRSLPGFSGSPVFVSIPPGSLRGAKKMMPFYSHEIGLLGIDTGHKRMTSRVRDKATDKPSIPERYVRQNSGVAIVSPYYKIRDVIEGETLTEQRKDARLKALSE